MEYMEASITLLSFELHQQDINVPVSQVSPGDTQDNRRRLYEQNVLKQQESRSVPRPELTYSSEIKSDRFLSRFPRTRR